MLFVGYGLAEMEILEYVLRKNPGKPPSQELRHFALFPYQSSEKTLVRYLALYFKNQCGVGLIPYCIDDRGYDTLCDVLSAWKEQIVVQPPKFIDLASVVLDQALKTPESAPRRESALKALSKNTDLVPYFFQHVKGRGWLEELVGAGFFDARHNPVPVSAKHAGYYTIPVWPAMQYLERLAEEIAESDDIVTGRELVQLIRHITYPISGSPPDNSRTWHSCAKVISALPSSAVTVDDLGMLNVWFSSGFDTTLLGHELGQRLLPKLLACNSPKNREKAIILLRATSRLRWVKRDETEQSQGDPIPLISQYEFEELLKRNATALGKRCGRESAEVLLELLQEVLGTPDTDKYTYVWRPAIEEHQQNTRYHDAREALVSGVRDLLLAFATADPPEAQKLLQELLNSRYLTLQRIAIYVIGQHYQQLGAVFWRRWTPKWFSLALRHELYHLLKTNYHSFTSKQRGRVLKVVTHLTRDWDDRSRADRLDAALRRDWLHAMQGQGDAAADEAYEACVKLAGLPDEHPDLAGYTTSRWVGDRSPMEADGLSAMSKDELLAYLRDFQSEAGWNSPNEDGLGKALKDVVRRDPEQFGHSLDRFLQTKLVYQYYILSGYEDHWKEKRKIPWEPVQKFCSALTSDPEFWRLPIPVEPLRASRTWIVSTIADLIRAGCWTDERAFDASLLPLAESILTTLIERQEPSAKGSESDAVTEALNTARGSCIEALFSYSLRQCRLEDQTNVGHRGFWKRIEPIYDRQLELLEDGNFEFATLAGKYLLNLWYMGDEWVRLNVDRLFSTSSPKHWRCAIQGFSYVTHFDANVYRLLRQKGHFHRALKEDFGGTHVREKLLQFVAVAYLNGVEELQDPEGVFHTMLDNWAPKDLADLVWFFWTLRDEEDARLREKVLEFWKHCYTRIQGHEQENARMLSKLNLLASFFSTITLEQKEWWLQAAPYADEDYNASFRVEALDRLATTNPAEVAEVFLRMLNRCLPTFDPKDIRSCVEKLYAKAQKEAADRICNEYERRGARDLLRDIYEKQRRST